MCLRLVIFDILVFNILVMSPIGTRRSYTNNANFEQHVPN